MKTLLWLIVMLGGCAADTTQARVRTAVDARQARLDTCYARSLARDDGEAGKMRVALRVSEGGDEVENVEVERSDLKSKKLQRCVKQALMHANLGGPADDNLLVEYTLAFRAENADSE